MTAKSYKVLDVREKESSYRYTDYHNSYTATHTVFTVIAEDTKGKRKRFNMYDKYKSKSFGEWCYYGYEGDFDLLVKGDWFEVEETENSWWPVIKILGVSDED